MSSNIEELILFKICNLAYNFYYTCVDWGLSVYELSQEYLQLPLLCTVLPA